MSQPEINISELEFASDQLESELRIRLPNGPFGSARAIMNVILQALEMKKFTNCIPTEALQSMQMVAQNGKLRLLIEKRINETKDWDSEKIRINGVSEDQAKFVTNTELKSILTEAAKL